VVPWQGFRQLRGLRLQIGSRKRVCRAAGLRNEKKTRSLGRPRVNPPFEEVEETTSAQCFRLSSAVTRLSEHCL
jgi:hypothetical protein